MVFRMSLPPNVPQSVQVSRLPVDLVHGVNDSYDEIYSWDHKIAVGYERAVEAVVSFGDMTVKYLPQEVEVTEEMYRLMFGLHGQWNLAHDVNSGNPLVFDGPGGWCFV